MAGDGYNPRAIFWICVLALFTAALSFSLRPGASGPIKAALLDPVVPLHSGEMIAAAIGLYGLSIASSPLTAVMAATLWAFGVCFMWPTMLAAAARRYPRSGPWGIGILGFAAAMAIYFVLPEIGKIYDRAKLAKAGGDEAFAALQPGPEMQQVMAFAAGQSFQAIAIVPAVLFFVFGAVFLAERIARSRSAAAKPQESAS